MNLNSSLILFSNLMRYETRRIGQSEIEEYSEMERRIMRRRNIYDDNSDTEEDLIKSNIEIDFRTYPLTIDWASINSTKNDSCNIIIMF